MRPWLQVMRLLASAVVSPWLVAVVAAFAVAMAIVHDVARVAQRGADIGRRVQQAKAALLADAAAMAAWQRPGGAAVPGFVVRSDGAAVLVDGGSEAGGDQAFAGRVLAGAAPTALGRALTIADVAGTAAGDLPRLDPAAVAQAVPAGAAPMFRRDPGIALMHVRGGTDADDFVFASSTGAVSMAGLGELAVLPGHLWIEAGATALVLDVPRDLVLVVQGNIYLLRSLQVRGPGRLVLVAAAAAGRSRFADVDGNGRWSQPDRLLAGQDFAGAIEGAGAVYCGTAERQEPLVCAASLVVEGQLHLRCDLRCAGPLVVAHGITRLRDGARCEGVGAWCFEPDREAVPGFATAGPARPSRLRPLAPAEAARMRDLPLYLAAPAR